MTTRVAITGGMASGKSTVLKILAEAGYTVASSDAIARDLLRDEALRGLVAAESGLPSGWRAEDLMAVITASPEIRRRVNRTLHPLVFWSEEFQNSHFVEVPLLFEGGFSCAFDRVWATTSSSQELKRRLQLRYSNTPKILHSLTWQLHHQVKEALADAMIRTDCPLASVREKTLHLASRLA